MIGNDEQCEAMAGREAGNKYSTGVPQPERLGVVDSVLQYTTIPVCPVASVAFAAAND